MKPYSSTYMATALKNSCFGLLVRSDFHIVVNLLIAVHTLPLHMLTSLSVDEILLSSYMNSSTDFSGYHLMWRCTIFIKAHELYFILDQHLLLPA